MDAVVDVKWAFNKGQWPVWLWRAENPKAPSAEAVKGAWRSGKSTVIFRKFTQAHIDHPGLRSLVVRRTYVELLDSCFYYIWNDPDNPDNWENLGLIKQVKQDNLVIYTKNGGRVDFRSALHSGREDPAKFGSISYGQILLEEASELSEHTYRTLRGRLSQKGMPLSMYLVFNPPSTRHWLHKEFENSSDPQKALFTLSMEDNRKHLPELYIESFDSQPKSWRRRYVFGDWGILTEGDPVYPNYSEDTHVSDNVLKWDRTQPVIRAMDGSVTATYFACVWMQLQRSGQLFILRHKLWRNEGVAKFKKDILRYSSAWFPDARFMDFGDPAMSHESKIEQMSVSDKLRPEINVRPGAVSSVDRKTAIDEWLLSNINLDGHILPAFQICPNDDTLMIRDGMAGAYCWKKLDEIYDKSHEPDKTEWSHGIEAMEYGATGIDILRWQLKRQQFEASKELAGAPKGSWMS